MPLKPDVPAPAEPALGEPAALPLPPRRSTGTLRERSNRGYQHGEGCDGDGGIIPVHRKSPLRSNDGGPALFLTGTISIVGHCLDAEPDARSRLNLRKLIAFDDDTLGKLTQLARDRMGTFQELADEAFADLLRKHGIPVDLKDALRKSAGVSRMVSKAATPKKTRSKAGKTTS